MPEPELKKTDRQLQPSWLTRGFAISETSDIKDALRQADMNWTVSKRPVATMSALPKLVLRDEKDVNKGIKNPELMTSSGTLDIPELRCALNLLIKKPDDKDLRADVNKIIDDAEKAYLPHIDEFSIVRNDNNHPFGIMGRIYECLDNIECIGMLQPLLDEKKAVIERAGYFNHGSNCWIIVRFPGQVEVGPDSLDQYLKLSWSHDGSEKLSATFICYLSRTDIQISPDVKGAKVSIEIRHTTNAKKRIKIAQELFTKGETYFQKVKEVLGELLDTPLTDKEMEEYLEILIPDTKSPSVNKHGQVKKTKASQTRDDILDIFTSTDDRVSGTKYGGFVSVVQYCDHNKKVKVQRQEGKTDEEIDQLRLDAQLKGLWSGAAKKMKDKAFKLIIE